MSRVLVCSTRVGEDKDTNDSVLYMATWRMPTYTSKGLLWYPKKDESISYIVVRRAEKPQTFEEFRHVLPGTLLEVYYGVNDLTGKSYVDHFAVVPGTAVLKAEDLYMKSKSTAATEAASAPAAKSAGKKAANEVKDDDDLPF